MDKPSEELTAGAWYRRLLRRTTDRGASLVEYALLIALIAVVCVVAITFFGGSASQSFSESTSTVFDS